MIQGLEIQLSKCKCYAENNFKERSMHIVMIRKNYDMVEVSKCRINLPISCSTYECRKVLYRVEWHRYKEHDRKVIEIR